MQVILKSEMHSLQNAPLSFFRDTQKVPKEKKKTCTSYYLM
jgi:hypothetical protein